MVVMVCILYSDVITSVSSILLTISRTRRTRYLVLGNVTYTLSLFAIVVALKVDRNINKRKKIKRIVSIKFFLLNMITILLTIIINSVFLKIIFATFFLYHANCKEYFQINLLYKYLC